MSEQEVPFLLAPSPELVKSPRWWVVDPAVWASVGNLAMTAVGAVVLTLPAATAQTGWLFGLVLIVFFGILADLSMVFLVKCGSMCGKDDYEGLGKAILGPAGGVIVRVILVLLLLGTLTAINIVVADQVFSYVNVQTLKTHIQMHKFV